MFIILSLESLRNAERCKSTILSSIQPDFLAFTFFLIMLVYNLAEKWHLVCCAKVCSPHSSVAHLNIFAVKVVVIANCLSE